MLREGATCEVLRDILGRVNIDATQNFSLPLSGDRDWGQPCFPCDFLLHCSTPPAPPVFPSTLPGLPRVLLSHLAAPDLALSSASWLVHSAAKTCYASSRSISFFM